MNGRVYDLSLGRFLSVDPVFQFPTNTQSLNPYTYVLNSPLTLTDPTGLESCTTGDGEGMTCAGRGFGSGMTPNPGSSLQVYKGPGEGNDSRTKTSAMTVAGGQVIEYSKDPDTIGGIADRGRSGKDDDQFGSGNAPPKSRSSDDDSQKPDRVSRKLHSKYDQNHADRTLAEALDAGGKHAGDAFDSFNAVAEYLHETVNPVSRSLGIEHTAKIYFDEAGNWTFTEIATSYKSNGAPTESVRAPAGRPVVADWHSHGRRSDHHSDEGFSDTDFGKAQRNKLLSTPDGSLKLYSKYSFDRAKASGVPASHEPYVRAYDFSAKEWK